MTYLWSAKVPAVIRALDKKSTLITIYVLTPPAVARPCGVLYFMVYNVKQYG